MAVTAKQYGNAVKNAYSGAFNLTSAPVKVALMKDTYVPNQATDALWSGISAHEVTGVGYTAGGKAVTSQIVSYAANVTMFDADDVEWADSTITARYAVVYASTGGQLLGYVDFGENKASASGSFKLLWNASGILSITAS